MGDAYAWPDWLRVDSAGTATINLEYSYTLDTRDTCDNAEAYVFMNAFFADHPGTNKLTAQEGEGWTIGPPNENGTTNVEYSDSIQAGTSKTVTDSVSWEISISGAEPQNWFSLWAYGEAGVEVAPVPIPASALLLASGLLGLIGIRRKFRKG